MIEGRTEAKAIARLVAARRNQTIAWVYMWNTSELSLLWMDDSAAPVSIDPPLPQSILDKAKPVSSSTTIKLLIELSQTDGSS